MSKSKESNEALRVDKTILSPDFLIHWFLITTHLQASPPWDNFCWTGLQGALVSIATYYHGQKWGYQASQTPARVLLKENKTKQLTSNCEHVAFSKLEQHIMEVCEVGPRASAPLLSSILVGIVNRNCLHINQLHHGTH
jgi:hypothetical protein